MNDKLPTQTLRRGWTTGACATAAAKAAFAALITGDFPDVIEITLPSGKQTSFTLAKSQIEGETAFAAIVKDAGDDPDVTHQALICVRVARAAVGAGVIFRAGAGVGTVTKPGLALSIGEPAINPIPREMIRIAVAEVAALHGVAGDVEIEISVPNGEQIAKKTWNPRLGILGGISILGTTGIVIPFSCAAWIHSIYRGIDVARAEGLQHIAGATGSNSEAAVQKLYNLPESALIDMGDFVGGMLKYLRKNPVEKITIAGGFGKMTKLAQGMLDLHSRAGSVDLNFLAELAGRPEIASANTAYHALEIAGVGLAEKVSALAWQTAAKVIEKTNIQLEIAVFDRDGKLLARAQER